ncbi:helix-turn-helix domain-containing protein, partial [Streptomyces sp. Act-28]
MTDGERAPEPRDIHDPAGFVARLQALKDRSGLTYRELSARAEAVGDSLPRSTVADMLARGTLPREELLVAFVRACGAGPEETERWLAARPHQAARPPHDIPPPCLAHQR